MPWPLRLGLAIFEVRLVRLISDVFNFGRASPKPNFGLCWFQSAAAPARQVLDVA